MSTEKPEKKKIVQLDRFTF